MDGRLEHIGTEELESIGRGAKYHVSGLSRTVGLTPRQLERVFRSRYALTPRAWLGLLLVRDAAALLCQGEQVKIVAAKMGFSDPCHFSRSFHRIAGHPPFSARSLASLRKNPDVAKWHAFPVEWINSGGYEINRAKSFSCSQNAGGPIPAHKTDMISPIAHAEAGRPVLESRTASGAITMPANATEILASLRAITKAWQAGVAQTIQLAQTVAQARRQLPRGQRSKLWESEEMPFAKRKGEMLVVIGERLNWANAQIFAQLPAQWTILYCIAQLPRKSIEHLIQTKVVHPKLKLSEAKALVRGTASISSESSQDDVKRQFGRFRRWLRRASSTWTPAQRDSARQLWEDLHPIVAATPESPSIDVSNARTS